MALSPAASFKRGQGADSPETASQLEPQGNPPPAQLFGTVHDKCVKYDSADVNARIRRFTMRRVIFMLQDSAPRENFLIAIVQDRQGIFMGFNVPLFLNKTNKQNSVMDPGLDVFFFRILSARNSKGD